MIYLLIEGCYVNACTDMTRQITSQSCKLAVSIFAGVHEGGRRRLI